MAKVKGKNIKEKGVKRMKKAIILTILLLLIPFCVVVWAGLDAAGGSLINCRTIESDTGTVTINYDAIIQGGDLQVRNIHSNTDNINIGCVAPGYGKANIISIRALYGIGREDVFTGITGELAVTGSFHSGTGSANYRLDAMSGGDVGSDTFTGSGLDDLTAGGAFTGTVADDIDYKVEIDANGTPDTFKWSDDGGSTWDATGVSITGSAQTLNNGITVTFGATDGHDLGDYWEFTVTVHNPMWLQDAAGDGILEVLNDGQVIFTGDYAVAAATVSAWEIDGNGDLMPINGAFNDPDWDLDENGDLMPAHIIYFETDTSGNLMPLG